MKNIFVYLISVLLVTSIFISCNNSETPLSPAGINYGFIKGKVHSRTETTDINSTDTMDYYGFAVQINGTTHRTITDSSGNWSFSNIPEGSYSICFKKGGYSDYMQTGVIVNKNDTLDFPIYLYKHTNSRMSNLTYSLTSSSLNLNYILTTAVQRDYYVRFYFSLDSNLGNPISNYKYSEAELLFNVPITPANRNYSLGLINLYQNGFSSGTKVYFYGNTAYKNQYYLDSISGRRVYNANSEFPTQKASLIIP